MIDHSGPKEANVFAIWLCRDIDSRQMSCHQKSNPSAIHVFTILELSAS